MRTTLFPHGAVLAVTLTLSTLPAGTGGWSEQSGSGPGALTIDFRALAADGQPVLDLTPADVTLKVDGRPREIRSLRLVRASAASTGTRASVLPAPFASNAASTDRRDIILLVDEESVTPGREQPLRDTLTQFLGALGPGDRVRLVSARQGGVNVGPTPDLAAIRAALPSIQGQGSTRETAQDLECRTSRLLGMLEGVFASAGRGSPATIVFFSASAASLKAGQVAQLGQETGTGLCQLRMDHFRQLGAAAQAARAHVFVVETLEVGGPQTLPAAAGGLENIAGSTGGEFLRLGGASEAQMARIAKETSAYYLAAIDPDAARSPSNRRVEVAVARPGVTVRVRNELSIPKPGARRTVNPRDMIRTADGFADLPLRATAFATRNKGDDKIKVVTLFEGVEPGTKLNAAMIGLFDEKGTLRGQWTAQSSDLSQPTVMAAVAVPAGKYRLRVAATDSSGRSGAVDSEIAPALIAAGPIGLSDMAFGSTASGGLAPVLQFRDQPAAIAFLELYGRPEGQLGARIELAETPDGPAITAVAVSAAASDEPDRFTLSGSIPLGSVAPGDYIVRAIIGVQGQPEGKVLRTLRKVASGS